VIGGLSSQLTMFLHRASDREKATLVLGAYFDESGTHPNPVIFSFAGYFFTVNRLRHFEREWMRVLCDFRIQAFHASPMEAREQGSEFEYWSNDQCDDLVSQLVAVINRPVLLGVSAVADAAAYQQDFTTKIPSKETVRASGESGWTKSYRHAYGDNPYVICMLNCLRVVSDFHAQKSRCHEPIACIFDERNWKGVITEIYDGAKTDTAWGARLGPLAFASDEVAIPLQAADLLAYMTRRHMVAMMAVVSSAEGQRLIQNGHSVADAAVLLETPPDRKLPARPSYFKLRKDLHRIAFMDAQGVKELVRRCEAATQH